MCNFYMKQYCGKHLTSRHKIGECILGQYPEPEKLTLCLQNPVLLIRLKKKSYSSSLQRGSDELLSACATNGPYIMSSSSPPGEYSKYLNILCTINLVYSWFYMTSNRNLESPSAITLCLNFFSQWQRQQEVQRRE